MPRRCSKNCVFVSMDDVFLLSLACAEMVRNLKVLSRSVARLSKRCEDSKIRCFETVFDGFENTGHGPHVWILSWKEREAQIKKMERYVAATATLHREIDELTVAENSIKKHLQCDGHKNDHNMKQQKILDLQHMIQWQKHKIKYLKEKSLWNRSFDTITSLLARSIFTILSRIKFVFNINHGYGYLSPFSSQNPFCFRHGSPI
ncbi:hypothetical protein R6Q59_014238 [Mikania micrantha]